MNRLRDKVAFITGAGAGIARAAALMFAREGARIAIAEIRPEPGRAAESAVREAGGEALFVETDVTREDSVQRAIAAAVARFGRIDVLYNCAGGAIEEDGSATDFDPAAWRHTMPLDLLGTLWCCRHAIPRLIEAGGGAVINMSSGAALRGSSPHHVYTAAKGAVLSLTRALAGAYAKHNVRVNAICAGRTLTERILGRYGTRHAPGPYVDRHDAAGRVKDYPFWVGAPEDIAAVALFLASDESRMITGAAIAADGGRSAY
jgi:NAD(P)-dependent dehydrogenase (short-subunit alcohol dehydrogenase family)